MAEQPLELVGKSKAEKDRRSVLNFFVKPRFGINFVRYFAFGRLAIVVVTVSLIYLRMLEIDALLNAPSALNAGGHTQVYGVFTGITLIGLMGLCVFTIYSCALSILFSHRVSGPMTAIVVCIEELKLGRYGFKRELRKHDALHPIHDALRDLDRVLQEREKGARASEN
jgi:hypothetical protein